MSHIGQLSELGPSQIASGTAPIRASSPSKTQDAAQQFEGLLLAQILHSARGEGNGWLGSGGDTSSDCAADYAEEQLAAVLSQKGGLGLARMIAAGLEKRD
jgi:Rod binding domain-containing protein